MGKYRYKCVEFKHMDWAELGNATFVTADQRGLLTFSWSHPRETGPLLERLVWLGQARRLEAVMEPSGTYGDALAWQLRQAGIVSGPG